MSNVRLLKANNDVMVTYNPDVDHDHVTIHSGDENDPFVYFSIWDIPELIIALKYTKELSERC